jgi:acyl carrier protein
MKHQEVLIKLALIINETFATNYSIDAQTSAEGIDEWDSISHIELITNIEKAFSVRFALSELQELKNVGEMVELVVKKLT